MANVNGRGIPQAYMKLTQTDVAASVAPVTVALGGAAGIPIAANQRMKIRYWIKVTVGAAGGLRAIVAVPAAGALFTSTIRLNNTVAPGTVLAVQIASAAFTNALANAGTHWLEIEVTVWNGANAGTVDLQMAQNTSDATALNVLAGSTADVIIL